METIHLLFQGLDRDEVPEIPENFTFCPDIGCKAEPVENSIDLVMAMSEAVTRDISDRHQVVTKTVNQHAMLTKGCPYPWLTARRGKAEMSCHSFSKLRMCEP